MNGKKHSLWYKDAIIYEVHVKAFYDSRGDGIGDFRGLIEKLDYLQDLGVTAIWLLPFYPSPFRDDGYDISDYRGIHSAYGTLRDFRSFIREAHRRNLKVITELVINHTSDQHPWFQAARRAKRGSARRNFYVWSDTDTKFPETRIIFTDTETSNWAWDPVAGAYYWHRFFSHQPDLNLNNPRVVQAVSRILRFWLKMGVDGLRLDAVPYLCVRENTNNENLPETHAVIKELRRQVDLAFQDRMLLAEANQWPEEVAAYFGKNDECHMAFHFPLMPRMFMALRQEDRYPITEILKRTPKIPDTCQWGLFLRNHDELTLEMVADSERDYMYREYATIRGCGVTSEYDDDWRPWSTTAFAGWSSFIASSFLFPERRSSTTATRSPWATTYILGTAMASEPRCSGRPTGMPAFPGQIRRDSIFLLSWIPSMVIRQ